MADLEKLAVARDRGYLVRLALSLTAGLFVAGFFFTWLTGGSVGGCLARNLGETPPADIAPK